MVENSFPTFEMVQKLHKERSAGFTNGKIIFTNFYTNPFKDEKYIEETINILYVHELIHTVDMKASEDGVYKITEIVLNKLRENYDK